MYIVESVQFHLDAIAIVVIIPSAVDCVCELLSIQIKFMMKLN